MNQTAPQKILDGREAFSAKFPDFNPQSDYFIAISFSFNGKVVTYSDGVTNVLAIGLENFSADDPDQLEITIAHEQIHLYQNTKNKNFSISGGLYRKIWSEGLAVFGSEEVAGGFRLSKYLNFTNEKMNEIYYLFYDLVDHLTRNIDTTDQEIVRAYIGAEENDLWIPPESGYYLGYFIVWQIYKQNNSVADMITWSAATARGNMLTWLPQIDVEGCSYRFSGKILTTGGRAVKGATVTGLPGNPVTDDQGYYSTTLKCEETGTAVPQKKGQSFNPASIDFGPGSSLVHVSDRNFTATGSGGGLIQSRSILILD